MAENTYRLSNPFSRIVGFSFGSPANGDFFKAAEIGGSHAFLVFNIGTAAPKTYQDEAPVKSFGFAGMIKSLDKLFGLFLNNADQFRALISGAFVDFGAPVVSADYQIVQSLIASAGGLGLQARASASFNRLLTDGNSQADVSASSPTTVSRSVAGESEMFIATQQGDDASIYRLNSAGSGPELVYSHSSADKSMIGISSGSIKKMPVANRLDDLCFAVTRGLNGEADLGFDFYINGSIVKSVDDPVGGTSELINLAAFDDGFGFAYFLTPASGNPSIYVGTLKWDGADYVLTEQSFEIDITNGLIRSANMGVSMDGKAFAWVVHMYDNGVDTPIRAAIYPSVGSEQQYAESTTVTFDFAFECIDVLPMADRVFFLVDNDSTGGDGVSTFSHIALVDSLDISGAPFDGGGNTLRPRNGDSNIALEPGYLRGTKDRAFLIAFNDGINKFRLLGSDGTDVNLDDQLPAFSSRSCHGLVAKENNAFAIMSTISAGPVSHLYHVDDAGTVLEYTGAGDAELIRRAQILRMQELESWSAT